MELSYQIKDPMQVRSAMYHIIDRTQHIPESQVWGITLAFISMCHALDLDISQMLESGRRMRADLNGPFTDGTFRAFEEYCRTEIGRR